jgi:hypothetical protein
LFEAKTSADLLKFSPLQQVVLADDPGGLAITASNNDPSLFVPELQPKPCVIRIELTSPADGVVQIFFLVGPETSYTEQHSVVQTVRAGDNTVYLKIEATGLKGRWRFDPGSAPGKYLLKSFEVRAAEARAVP